MKKRVKDKNNFLTYLSIVLLLLIVIGSFIYFKFGMTGNVIYSQGDGSVGNPFVITNCTELQVMNENLTANYVLGNDIDCSDTRNWNGGQGFVPIGNDVYSLTGIFSGNNHFVSNLLINLTLNDSVGLIGSLEGSVLNLNVINASIFGKGYAGGLVGGNYGSIINSSFSGNVSGSADQIGGLVGFNSMDSIITSSYSIVNVFGKNNVGGLIGRDNYGSVTQVYSISNVTASGNNVGGLIGRADRSYSLDNSFSRSNVFGINNVGGLIGYYQINDGGQINNSFTISNISGTENLGGFIGFISSSLHVYIRKCYSASTISSSTAVSKGGLYGASNSGTFLTSFLFNNELFSSSDPDGKTTADMKNIATYSGWDFQNVWSINSSKNDGYPYFNYSAQNLPNSIISKPSGYCPSNMYGLGTTDSPCEIISCTQLQAMNDNLTLSYQLMNDIDCSDTRNWNNGSGFEPIGYADYVAVAENHSQNVYGGWVAWKSDIPFQGNLNGNKYSVSNLFINRSENIGLFEMISSANITNLRLKDISFSTNDTLNFAYYSPSLWTSAVPGYIGGISAVSANGNIINCSVTGTLTSLGNYTVVGAIGGLVGGSAGDETTHIENSYSNILINAGIDNKWFSSNGFATNIGGIAGYLPSLYISNSYSSGSIICSNCSYIGGLGGIMGQIDSSYSNVAMFAQGFDSSYYGNSLGGLVGWNYNSVNNSFFVGSPSGSEGVAGLIGSLSGFVGNLYWGLTGQSPTSCYAIEPLDFGNPYNYSNENCTKISDINYFKGSVKTKQPFLTWDFDNIWAENVNDYPILKWQVICGDAKCSTGESCSTCSSDCGSCGNSNSGSSGGGGGGGGSGGAIKNNSISTQNGIGLNNNLINYNDNSTNIDFQKNSDSNASSFKLNVFSKGVVGSIVILSILLIIFLVFAKPIAEMFEEYSERRKEITEQKRMKAIQEEQLRIAQQNQNNNQKDETPLISEDKQFVLTEIKKANEMIDGGNKEEAKEIYNILRTNYQEIITHEKGLYSEILKLFERLRK